MTEQGSCQIQEVNVLVRITDASDKWERGNYKFTHTHTHTHTHIPNWTGNSHSVKSCILPVFCTNRKQWYFPGVDKFCFFVCCLLISVSWFVLFRFGFHCICYFHSFLAVAWQTGLVIFTETLPFFFQKHQKKKGWSSLCSISAECVQQDKMRPMQGFTHFRFIILPGLMVLPRKQKVIFQKQITTESLFLSEARICLHSKTLIYVFHCFAWNTFTEPSLQLVLGTKLTASWYLGNTPGNAFSFLTSKKKKKAKQVYAHVYKPYVWLPKMVTRNGFEPQTLWAMPQLLSHASV